MSEGGEVYSSRRKRKRKKKKKKKKKKRRKKRKEKEEEKEGERGRLACPPAAPTWPRGTPAARRRAQFSPPGCTGRERDREKKNIEGGES